MILFHGTLACNLKSILSKGLLPPSRESWAGSWPDELGVSPSVFLCNQPKAGSGSSPLEFANDWEEQNDGILIVVDMPGKEFTERFKGIWSTHDVKQYYFLRWEIDMWYEVALGPGPWATSDTPKVLEWLHANRPDLPNMLHIRDGWLVRNPAWMVERRRTQMTLDCQILTDAIPQRFIATTLKVYDAKSGRVVPEFDPKRQQKEKHKKKTFASLVWHGLKKRGAI